jgi:hypothetical protein
MHIKLRATYKKERCGKRYSRSGKFIAQICIFHWKFDNSFHSASFCMWPWKWAPQYIWQVAQWHILMSILNEARGLKPSHHTEPSCDSECTMQAYAK